MGKSTHVLSKYTYQRKLPYYQPNYVIELQKIKMLFIIHNEMMPTIYWRRLSKAIDNESCQFILYFEIIELYFMPVEKLLKAMSSKNY